MLHSHYFPEAEVIIVDDGSKDGTAAYFESFSKENRWLVYHRNETNLKFARSCNAGAERARGEYLIFLNNDTLVSEGWDRHLLETIEKDRDTWIVGAKCLYPDRTIQHAGVYLPDLDGNKLGHVYRFFPEYFPPANLEKELQCVTAACMIMRRENFWKVGGFDTSYMNGLEDVDLCLKVVAKGKKIRYQPQSEIIHIESKSEGRYDHARQNNELLWERWKGKIQGDYTNLVEQDIVTCLKEGMMMEVLKYDRISDWQGLMELNPGIAPGPSGNIELKGQDGLATILLPAMKHAIRSEVFIKIDCRFTVRPVLKVICQPPGHTEAEVLSPFINEGSNLILLNIPRKYLDNAVRLEYSGISGGVELVSLAAYTYPSPARPS